MKNILVYFNSVYPITQVSTGGTRYKKVDEELGQRHEMVQKAYDLSPRTKAEDS